MPHHGHSVMYAAYHRSPQAIITYVICAAACPPPQDALAKLAAVTSEMQEGQVELRQQSARLMDMRQQVSGLQETMAALGAEKEALKVRCRCHNSTSTSVYRAECGMSWSVLWCSSSPVAPCCLPLPPGALLHPRPPLLLTTTLLVLALMLFSCVCVFACTYAYAVPLVPQKLMRQVAERDSQIATQREQLEASAAAQAALEAQLVAAGTRIAELEETAVAAAGMAGVSPEVEEKLAEALGAAETLMLQVRGVLGRWGRRGGKQAALVCTQWLGV